MIEESGEIISCEGEYAWVETRRKSACASCSANKGCGTGTLSKLYGERFNRVRALNDIRAVPGQQVVIGLEENALVRGSLAVYGLPLVTLVVAALLGKAVATEMAMQEADGLIALFGLAGLAFGFYLVRIFSRKVAHDSHYQPVILRRCDAVSGETVVDAGQ
jgi:sigma-E factor negative regulatory protein RseC